MENSNIWNECYKEMSPEGQVLADSMLKYTLTKLQEHNKEYNSEKTNPIYGIGEEGAKELIVALIKKGYIGEGGATAA